MREIASAISEEEPYVDFLWSELYEGSMSNTVGVVLEINDESAGAFLGDPDYYDVSGGDEGDGVYVLMGEELEGYPSNLAVMSGTHSSGT